MCIYSHKYVNMYIELKLQKLLLKTKTAGYSWHGTNQQLRSIKTWIKYIKKSLKAFIKQQRWTELEGQNLRRRLRHWWSLSSLLLFSFWAFSWFLEQNTEANREQQPCICSSSWAKKAIIEIYGFQTTKKAGQYPRRKENHIEMTQTFWVQYFY